MKRFLMWAPLLGVLALMGFRPFHFTTDPDGEGTWSNLGDGGSWTVSGGVLSHSGAVGDDALRRNTDLAENQIVEARLKDPSSVSFPGVFANASDGDNYYLADLDDSGEEIELWAQSAGVFTQIGGFSQTVFTDQFYDLKLTTQTDGLNKILNVLLDGATVIGPVTTATLLSGQVAGIYAAGNTAAYDWWAFNTAITITSLSPNHGPPGGGTPVTFVGADFGDAAVPKFGGSAASAVTLLDLTAGTTLVATSPSGSGTVAVTVFFGTLGSEEYQGGGQNFSYDTATATPTFSWTPTDTGTSTATPTFTATPTHTPTQNISSTVTGTFTISGTFTTTPTISATKTVTPTHSPEHTETLTDTLTASPTFTITKTFTVSPTFSTTKTWTPTGTDTVTETPTSTWTGTISPTPTQTEILTTRSPTPTVSATRTRTPVIATLAASKTPTTSATVTKTRTPSPTRTPTKTVSFTKTRSPIIATKTRTRTFTPQSTHTFTRTPTP